MKRVITSELVEAYPQCHRRALFLLCGQPQGVLHEYEQIIAERASANRSVYLGSFTSLDSTSHSWNKRLGECQDGVLVTGDLRANCDAISQADRRSPKSHVPHEPHLVVGTYSITRGQRIWLAFAGFVIGEMQRHRPKTGWIVPVADKPQRIRIESLYLEIRTIVADLRKLVNTEFLETPPPILNKHCSTCPFHQHCLREAEKADSLSLLERMTPKLLRKYQSKGIFTVTQLSHVFKPRRRRKRKAVTPPTFNVELQALALRTGKIYLNEPPSIPDNPVELFLDIEGIPDENFHYLIGLLIKDHNRLIEHSFWANSVDQEKSIFEACTEVAARFKDTPIYHYGNYELKALRQIQAKYGIDCELLTERLVNVNASVFGKVYFPSRSNSLKDLGALVGATWDSPNASGLQSLVWRLQWDRHETTRMKSKLIPYNISDCHALRLLTAELHHLGNAATDRDDVDFINAPKQGKALRLPLTRYLLETYFPSQSIFFNHLLQFLSCS